MRHYLPTNLAERKRTTKYKCQPRTMSINEQNWHHARKANAAPS
jgi:membrane-bound inhibitor of C-type lysozyme